MCVVCRYIFTTKNPRPQSFYVVFLTYANGFAIKCIFCFDFPADYTNLLMIYADYYLIL